MRSIIFNYYNRSIVFKGAHKYYVKTSSATFL